MNAATATRTHPARALLLPAVGAAIAAVAASAALVLRMTDERSPLLPVKPGVLYRSGDLEPEDMEAAVRRYNIKTIVNLRPDVRFAARGMSEQTWAEGRGLRYLYLPFNKETEKQDILRFLEAAASPDHQPVLVHCHHGRLRTGLFVAAYRVALEGWSAPDAVAEMVRLGGKEDSRSTRILRELSLRRPALETKGKP